MLLFLDESGTDHGVAPYEVTGGIAIDERYLWEYVLSIADIEERCFGGRLSDLCPGKEFKGKNLLGRDKFRFAAQSPALPAQERRELACRFLHRGQHGEAPRREEFTAYGQACLTYVDEVLSLSQTFGVRVFAVMVAPEAPLPSSADALRRDVAFLFERYFYYLQDLHSDARGLVVFDELEKSQCRRLIERMHGYFLRTRNGQERSGLIIPEPFFVHSDLTTGTRVADVVIYVLNWAYRFSSDMDGPVREELRDYASKIEEMVFQTVRTDENSRDWPIYGVKYISDLRAREERNG